MGVIHAPLQERCEAMPHTYRKASQYPGKGNTLSRTGYSTQHCRIVNVQYVITSTDGTSGCFFSFYRYAHFTRPLGKVRCIRYIYAVHSSCRV